ncbi:hypothetical protein Tco_0549137 [Tanacetum coccineum]
MIDVGARKPGGDGIAGSAIGGLGRLVNKVAAVSSDRLLIVVFLTEEMWIYLLGSGRDALDSITPINRVLDIVVNVLTNDERCGVDSTAVKLLQFAPMNTLLDVYVKGRGNVMFVKRRMYFNEELLKTQPATLESDTGFPSDDFSSGNPTSTSEPFTSEFTLEEIDAYLYDKSISLESDHDDCDPEEDIYVLEQLLNDDPFNFLRCDIKQSEVTEARSSIEEPPELELKDLPSHLEYAYL